MGHLQDLGLRFRDARSALGFWRTLSLAPRWAVRQEYVVVVRDLTRLGSGPASDSEPENLRWAPIDDNAIRQFAEIRSPLSLAEVRRRLDERQECLVGWLGSTLVHYRWETMQPAYLPYLDTVFSPGEGEILVVESFTAPRYRGRGIHGLATARMLARARARGASRSIAFIASWHAPALRVSLRQASGRVAGIVTRWDLGIVRRLRVTGEVCLTGTGLALAVPRPAYART